MAWSSFPTRTACTWATSGSSPCSRSWSVEAPLVHPTASQDPAAHRLGLPNSLIDFTADTTRAMAQMLYSNQLARTPSVKVHPLPRRRRDSIPGGPLHPRQFSFIKCDRNQPDARATERARMGRLYARQDAVGARLGRPEEVASVAPFLASTTFLT
jgi:hypothetical protein